MSVDTELGNATDETPLATVTTAPIDVSVVIISKDEPMLARTLECLAAEVADFDGRAEVVVVDASAGRLDDIRIGAPWVRWLDFRAPLGTSVSIPHQRNTGVRAARGSVVAFCDAGGEPERGWLRQLVAPILRGERHASCGPVRSVAASIYTVLNDLADGEIPDTPPTANMAFTRAAFDAVGGFDETFRYGSDVDFAWRLEGAGTPVRQVRAAVMGMDWGDRRRQSRRSRWYGEAQARLWLKHRRRWRELPRTAPVLLVYPAAIVALVPALLRAVRRRPSALVAWCAIPIGLVVKNRRAERPVEVVRQNALFGVGALTHLLVRPFRHRAPVQFVPREDGAYQGKLLTELRARGVDVDYLGEPTRSATANLVLLPWTALAARLGGARIIHVHWTWSMRPWWARRALTRRLWRWWFTGWLWWTRRIGLQVVWTAHNVLPHTAVFDDDQAARRCLVRASAAVVALNEHAAGEVAHRWGAEPTVIGLPIDPLAHLDRSEARAELGVADDRFCVGWFGLVAPYKGVPELVRAVAALPSTTLLLAGRCTDRDLEQEVDALLGQVMDARWDRRFVDDDDLAVLCAAADVLAFPFTAITTSLSVPVGMGTGRPVVIPDLPGLADIPDEACIRYPAGAATGLAEALARCRELDRPTRERMGAAAARHAAVHRWTDVAAAHEDVYRRVLDGSRR